MGAVVRELVTVGRSPVVVVVAPGGSNMPVGDAVADGLVEAELDVERVTGQRAAASSPATTDSAAVMVVTEAQWIDEVTLDRLRASDRTLIVVHRPVALVGTLAVIHAESYEHGAVVRLGSTTVDELVDAGWTADDADEAVDATNGRPDLLATWRVDGDLVGDVTTRLSLLDETTRFAVELRVFGATTGDLAGLLDLTPERHDAAVQAIESEGLTDDGEFPPGVVDAVRAATPPGRRSRVVDLLVERAAPGGVVALADALAGSDDRSAAAGQLYGEAAAELVGIDHRRSAELLELAKQCGVDQSSTAPVAAELALLRGDPADALRLLGDPGADPDAGLLAAAAWYALGDAAAAADALATSALPELAPWAASAVGQTIGHTADGVQPPTRPDLTATALAEAVDAWLTGDHARASDLAARALIRAPTSTHRYWPAAPHAIAGTINSRLGDLVRAAQIADAAAAERAGGPLHRRAELLDVAWCAARQGRLDDASAAIGELGDDPLSPREQWIRAGVSCALAVRDPDPDDLDSAASGASVALAGRTADLYDLEILGEIAAALARVGAGTVDGLLDSQEALLDRLGRPPHLEFDLAWVRLLAALSVDDDETLVAAARRVVDHDAPPPVHEVAVAVGRTVLACEEGGVDADDVLDVANRLADLGRLHEAARLCGIAAVRAGDERTTRRLLKRSREWRTRRARVKQLRGVDRTVTRLSEQEERVARLVDDGLTYKAIGAELFISPKTVEHHVAHIRSKLGAGSRAELLSAIRGYVSSDVASSPS